MTALELVAEAWVTLVRRGISPEDPAFQTAGVQEAAVQALMSEHDCQRPLAERIVGALAEGLI